QVVADEIVGHGVRHLAQALDLDDRGRGLARHVHEQAQLVLARQPGALGHDLRLGVEQAPLERLELLGRRLVALERLAHRAEDVVARGHDARLLRAVTAACAPAAAASAAAASCRSTFRPGTAASWSRSAKPASSSKASAAWRVWPPSPA